MNVKAAKQAVLKMSTECQINQRWLVPKDLMLLLEAMQSPAQEEIDCGCGMGSSCLADNEPIPTTSEIDKANGENEDYIDFKFKKFDKESLADKFIKCSMGLKYVTLSKHYAECLEKIAESHFKDRIDQARKEGYYSANKEEAEIYCKGKDAAIASMKEKFEKLIGPGQCIPMKNITKPNFGIIDYLRIELFGTESKS